jgi:hypothetical protein
MNGLVDVGFALNFIIEQFFDLLSDGLFILDKT